MIGKKCRVDGCSNLITVRGTLCCKHRTRWQRHKTFKPSQKALNRFRPVINKWGYVRVNKGKGRVLEHVWVMEQFIGRKLKPGELVHHINENRSDNRIENLQLMTISEHQRYHRSKKHYTPNKNRDSVGRFTHKLQ